MISFENIEITKRRRKGSQIVSHNKIYISHACLIYRDGNDGSFSLPSTNWVLSAHYSVVIRWKWGIVHHDDERTVTNAKLKITVICSSFWSYNWVQFQRNRFWWNFAHLLICCVSLISKYIQLLISVNVYCI